MGINKTFRHIYFIYMHMTVMMVVPFSLLTFMNTMLIRAVRRSQHTKGKVGIAFMNTMLKCTGRMQHLFEYYANNC